jgi:hypothetical protein
MVQSVSVPARTVLMPGSKSTTVKGLRQHKDEFVYVDEIGEGIALYIEILESIV